MTVNGLKTVSYRVEISTFISIRAALHFTVELSCSPLNEGGYDEIIVANLRIFI